MLARTITILLTVSVFFSFLFFLSPVALEGRPTHSKKYLGGVQSILIMDEFTRVYPVTHKNEKLTRLVPPAILDKPDAGETSYFCIHRCKELAIGDSCMKNSRCGGEFCDRQDVLGLMGVTDQTKCGCFYSRDEFKYVTEHSISFPCHESVDDQGVCLVKKFRSLRFDRLLFAKPCEALMQKHKPGESELNACLNEACQKLVKYINGKHGWTIIGWLRCGKKTDESEVKSQEFDISSEEVTPHVIYLAPTNEKDLDEKINREVKNLRLTSKIIEKRMQELFIAAQDFKKQNENAYVDSDAE